MTRRLRPRRKPSLLALIALIGAAALLAPPRSIGRALPSADQGRLARVEGAIREQRIEDARELLGSLTERYPSDPQVAYVQALLAFHEGHYDRAVEAIERSMRVGQPTAADDARPGLAELLRATRDATAGHQDHRSEDGRFIVSVAPGPDEILVPYALDAMRSADHALSEFFGMRVPGPIRLEIYPSASELARVSTLSEEAIETTGTIALCKWDRLMVTSPRALLRGYPWMDTIAHEYVHLVLARASRDRAPVWFQEGLAKLLERTWRGEDPEARLPTPSATLLGRALHEDALLPFERFHPSIAMLPSQDDAALAFAQVSTFFETFLGAHGVEGIRQAVLRISGGADAREALAAVAGVPFVQLEQRWKEALSQREWPGADAPTPLPLRFRGNDDDLEDLEDVSVERAARLVRLGDLLWDRGRSGAAAVEYGRAHREAPNDPIVASRFARAALRSGDAAAAIGAARSVLSRHPDHAPAHALLASARRLSGDEAGAVEAAREAIRLNPFDPRPHCDLAAVSPEVVERDREASVCQRLGGGAGR